LLGCDRLREAQFRRLARWRGARMTPLASNALLLIHAFATLLMTGAIWVVQVVHYPLFAMVGADRYSEYQQAHMRRVTLIVAPAMSLEIASAGALLVFRPPSVPIWMAILGVVMVGVLWASTALMQAPMHYRLVRGFDAVAHRSLVATNWLRTILWTARGGLALAMLVLGVSL